jgi:hypothetical protein
VHPRSKAAPKTAACNAADAVTIPWLQTQSFREGSGCHQRTVRLRKDSGKTVEAFLAARGQRGTVARCVGLRLVKLS